MGASSPRSSNIVLEHSASIAEARDPLASTLRMSEPSRGRIGILGHGIGALACAHYVARAGLRPVLLANGPLGAAIGRRFRASGCDYDCFHVPLRASDTALCGLLAELGLLHRVAWRSTGTGFYASDASGLLQSRRARVQWAFRAWIDRSQRAEATSERFSAGHAVQLVRSPAHKHGYLQGGYRTLVHALEASIEAHGGQILEDLRLHSVDADGRGGSVEWEGGSRHFDALISTLPISDLAKLSSGSVLGSLPFAQETTPSAEVSVALLNRRALALPYVTTPLQDVAGRLEIHHAAALVPEQERGALHPVYVTHRCESHGGTYQATDATLVARALELLRQLEPGWSERDIGQAEVFRAPHVDLTLSREEREISSGRRVGNTRLLLCAASRPYVRRASVDTSVMLARETVSQLVRSS